MDEIDRIREAPEMGLVDSMALSQRGTLHGQLSQSYRCTNTNLTIVRLAVAERTLVPVG